MFNNPKALRWIDFAQVSENSFKSANTGSAFFNYNPFKIWISGWAFKLEYIFEYW